MMEKQNKTIEKRATGDSRDLDDIVDAGMRRFAKPDRGEQADRKTKK